MRVFLLLIEQMWGPPSTFLLHFQNFSPMVVLIRKMRAANNSTYEPRHEISNNVVCATSKASDQPAHMCSLIIAFASRMQFI